MHQLISQTINQVFLEWLKKLNLTDFCKTRDQKQIYRLNETMSHWGLNPPPLAE